MVQHSEIYRLKNFWTDFSAKDWWGFLLSPGKSTFRREREMTCILKKREGIFVLYELICSDLHGTFEVKRMFQGL